MVTLEDKIAVRRRPGPAAPEVLMCVSGTVVPPEGRNPGWQAVFRLPPVITKNKRCLFIMKRLLLLFLIVISGCAKWQALESDDFKNALIIKPLGVTKADNGILTSDGETVYTIGSVFVAENASPDLKAGIYYSTYRFYQKKFDKYPGLREESLLVSISGTKYSGVEYTAPGQHINRIAIMGIDESFGLGTTISIPMVEGKYNGGNPLIKDVQIKSFKLSSNTITLQPGQLFPTENDIVINADADINIVIISTVGVILTLSYIDDVTLGDGLAY